MASIDPTGRIMDHHPSELALSKCDKASWVIFLEIFDHQNVMAFAPHSINCPLGFYHSAPMENN